jgi:sigma-B regulation protein RsbU (phosphoserine phosphatase)
MLRMVDRILVADDQVDVLESLRLLLKNEGFAIEAVTSPKGVLDALQLNKYDVLLLDMNYARDTTSGREGIELLSEIHRMSDTLPVVLMTAWGTVDLAVEAMRTGSFDFIEKPWNNNRLIDTLRRNIKEGRARQEKRKLEANSTEMMRDLDEAHQTQQRLLPSELPQMPGVEIQASWLPAKNIGGDYYDAIKLDDETLAFCIADVAGKGLPAALVMSNIQAAVRAYANTMRSPADLCKQLNRLIFGNTQTMRFVTFFYGVLDIRTRGLRYTNAGHVPPILIRKDGTPETLSEGGMVLGPFSDSRYQEASVVLHSGDRLVLLTDGITEAANAAGEQFADSARITDLLVRNRGLTSAKLRDTLLDAVTSFSDFSDGDLEDDATLIVLSIL